MRKPLRPSAIFPVFTLVLILLPFLWQIITSLKAPGEIFTRPVTLLPREAHMANYVDVFASGPPFHRYLLNSFLIAGFATVVCLIAGSVCGYSLGRLPLKGKNVIMGIFLAAAMFPQVAVISPLFLVMRSLGLLNTHAGLGLVYTAFGLPLAVWMFGNFFKDLPRELEEAALIDGCTPASVLWRIVLPVAGPGFFSAAILVFIFSWNEFLFALVFNTGIAQRTVTVCISLFPGLYETPWGTIFAGLTAGAVK